MRLKKQISFFLFVIMVIGNMAGFAIDDGRLKRDVYLHANGTENGNISTVYMGDDVNVYLAIDNPNKGMYDADGISEDSKHKEPQYDMNGYIVKFYYDSDYFELKNGEMPINCNVPMLENVSEPDIPADVNDFSVPAGFYIESRGTGTETVNGKIYNTAYITVLFNGIWLPQKKDDTGWYNLCSLPLIPKKTGITEVFIETNDTQENHSLELLAKNVTDYPVNFELDIVNGGYHQINIKNKLRPNAPEANPKAGSYDKEQNVTLTAEEDCAIYYTQKENPTDADWIRFNDDTPIKITTTTEIKCKAVRSDGKESDIVSYKYQIVPSAPKLFQDENGQKNLLEEVYNSDNQFRVYVSNNNPYTIISEDCEIYYTFSVNASAEDMSIGDNPEKDWVKVNKQYNYIDIAKTCTVRLVTVKGGERSYVTVYHFGIKPAPALASPEPAENQKKTEVTLVSATKNAEIYYTVDGSDPRTGGILYTSPIMISQTTTLRTAAKFNNIYSDLKSYDYIINPVPKDAVTAYPPAGIYEEVSVELSTPNGRDIYYTTNGSNPSDNKNTNRKQYKYGEPVFIDKDTRITAVSIDENGNAGEEYVFDYKIKPAPPIFAPESTQFAVNGTVAVYNASPNKNYSLYYTTDGTDPKTSSSRIKADGDNAVINVTKYTGIKAVSQNENGAYSDAVSNVYDIIGSRPSKPVVSLEEGVYTLKNGNDEGFTTGFLPVPDGVTIYYTVAYNHDGDYPQPDPNKGYEQTKIYKPGEDILLRGETIIKAVAENAFGIRSDMGVFHYTIVPEAPSAPPSTTFSGGISILPVTAVPGSAVTYTVNGFTNTFTVPDNGLFYIDPNTGNAYVDEKKINQLGTDSGTVINAPINLSISCEKDGISSAVNSYQYSAEDNDMPAAPYADKSSGKYKETAIDDNNNLLSVKLMSINKEDEIQYRTAADNAWKTYSSPILLKDDTVLYIRAAKNGKYSDIATYVYTFIPPEPVITPSSGKYSNMQTVKLSVPDTAPTDRDYTIYYKRGGDRQDVRYTGVDILIEKSQSIKAYIVENDLEDKAKYSGNETAYYIIDTSPANGKVSVAEPFFSRRRFETKEITKAPYSYGINLISNNADADIMYTYEYTLADGSVIKSAPELQYKTPVMVTSSMTAMTITAWLVDENGAEIDKSRDTFEYAFVTLNIPITSLEKETTTAFKSGTEYTILNDYPNDKTINIYYTLDGSNPTLSDNTARKLYKGEKLKITGSTTLKAVYVSSCGNCGECNADNPGSCMDALYGDAGTYKYTVLSTNNTGGGGGIRSTPKPTPTPVPTPMNTPTPTPNGDDNQHTKDYFGRTAAEHVSYISGYPDGTVRADNNITREEIAQIVFTIMEKKDSPKKPDGLMYPDVSADRWSAQPVEYLSEQNIIEGYPDGAFHPADNMTRAEFCTMISRFLGLDTLEKDMKFNDISKEHWGFGYVNALYQEGFISGYEDETFRPDRELTRAEAITIFNKILGRKPLAEYLVTTDFNLFEDLFEDRWYFADVLESVVIHKYALNKDGYEEVWYRTEK